MSLTPAVQGLLSGLALAVGAVVGAYRPPSERVTGMLLAVASGALMAAAAFELAGPAMQESLVVGIVAFAAGGAVFVGVDSWLDRYADPSQATVVGEGGAVGLSLVAAVVLDGVPENLALGLQGGGSGAALLVAVAFSNLPEAIAGAAAATRDGDEVMAPARVVGLWSTAGLLLVGAAALGPVVSSVSGIAPIALAFAAGAVVASVSDTILPQAFRRADPWTAVMACLGFGVAAAVAQGG